MPCGVRGRCGSPLAGLVSEQRRYATVSMRLADLRAVRAEHSHTINDVVLAVVTGGLRYWLLTRGESIGSGSSLTALVPMSVTEDDGEPTSLGSQVAPHLQRLPIGEPNPLMRLHQVAYATQAHKDSGRAVDARSLSDIAGFAPTTLHALGVRVAAEVMRKQHDLLVTNVPGPQVPLYAAGARLAASYPVLPLSAGHLLTIGVTSYNGDVYVGLTADRDAIRDLDVLAQCLTDALEELLDTTVRGCPVTAADPEGDPGGPPGGGQEVGGPAGGRGSEGDRAEAGSGAEPGGWRPQGCGPRAAGHACSGEEGDDGEEGHRGEEGHDGEEGPHGEEDRDQEDGGDHEGSGQAGDRGRMTALVFVPLDRAAASVRCAPAPTSDRGSAVRRPPVWPAASGRTPLPEEVEYAALSHAGVLALTPEPTRCAWCWLRTSIPARSTSPATAWAA